MFLDFYQLREQPFGVTPDPAYLYPSRTHCEALDSLTEEGIVETIREVAAGGEAITILIAHRLSTILHADRIFVLERGRIVDIGHRPGTRRRPHRAGPGARSGNTGGATFFALRQ